MSMQIDKGAATRLARNLKRHLAATHGLVLKHTQCLDAVAAEFDFRNRHEMHAAYTQEPATTTGLPAAVLDLLRRSNRALASLEETRLTDSLVNEIAAFLKEHGGNAARLSDDDTEQSADDSGRPDDAIVFQTDAGWWWRDSDAPEADFDRWVGGFSSRDEAIVDARKNGRLGGDDRIQEWDVDVSALVRGFAVVNVRDRQVELSGWIHAFATIQIDATDEEQARVIAEARWEARQIPAMIWNARPDVRVVGATVDDTKGEFAPDLIGEATDAFIVGDGLSRLDHELWNARPERGVKDYAVDAVNPG